MKILIDIPKEDVAGICSLSDEQLSMLPVEVAETLIRIRIGATGNVTNGDVIKAMFPNYSRDFLIVNMDRNSWWNTPYKVESEG